jgi:hypothetical protein
VEEVRVFQLFSSALVFSLAPIKAASHDHSAGATALAGGLFASAQPSSNAFDKRRIGRSEDGGIDDLTSVPPPLFSFKLRVGSEVPDQVA